MKLLLCPWGSFVFHPFFFEGEIGVMLPVSHAGWVDVSAGCGCSDGG